MGPREDFEAAAEKVKNLKAKPTDDELLEIYALFKQATVGDVNTAQPWAVQMKERAKWDAWNKMKGMTKDSAMEAYIAKANLLVETYGLK